MCIFFKDTWHVFQENLPRHFWGLNLWQVLLSLYANSAPLRSGFTVTDIFVVTVMLTLVKYLKLWLSTAHTHTLLKSFFPFFKMWPNVTAPMAAFQREVIIPQSWQCEEVNRDERGAIKVGLCNDFLLLQGENKREYVNHCDFDRKSGINLIRVAVGVLSRRENKCLQVLTWNAFKFVFLRN